MRILSWIYICLQDAAGCADTRRGWRWAPTASDGSVVVSQVFFDEWLRASKNQTGARVCLSRRHRAEKLGILAPAEATIVRLSFSTRRNARQLLNTQSRWTNNCKRDYLKPSRATPEYRSKLGVANTWSPSLPIPLRNEICYCVLHYCPPWISYCLPGHLLEHLRHDTSSLPLHNTLSCFFQNRSILTIN